MRIRLTTAGLLAAGAISCTQPSPEPITPASPPERLEAILNSEITHAQDSLYAAFAAEQGRGEMMLLLPALALDTTAAPLARANAVLRMGAIPMPDFETYARTIEDPDPRVRGATLGVVGPLAHRDPPRAMPILAQGLVDPELGIQAKALQELRDRDLDLLRFYIGSTQHEELRLIALQTLRSAYSWGAPLIPEADGTLRRTTPAGVELALRPERAWPDFDLVLGTLTVTPLDGAPRPAADSVEVMATIIPAVGDPTGRWLAIESARRIEIHDLESGTTRVLGPGVAPRPLPFTPDFFYFRELGRNELPNQTQIRYELVRAPFDAGQPIAFDTVNVTAQLEQRGYMSPVRWARIIDRGTRFVIDTDGLRNHRLPGPGAVLAEDEE